MKTTEVLFLCLVDSDALAAGDGAVFVEVRGGVSVPYGYLLRRD